MNSGRIAVCENAFYCGSGTNAPCQLALKSDIPTVTPYVHPTTKQCNYVYTHPSTIQCNAASEINSLKSSVSSGKTSLANAITGKGVATSSSDTFATMTSKIGQIQVGLSSIQQQLLSSLNINRTITTSYDSAERLYIYRNGTQVSASMEQGSSGDSDVLYSIIYGNYQFYISTGAITYNVYTGAFSVGAPEFGDRSSNGGSNFTGASLNSYNAYFDIATARKITTVNITFSPISPWALDAAGNKTGTITLTEQFSRSFRIDARYSWSSSGSTSFTY